MHDRVGRLNVSQASREPAEVQLPGASPWDSQPQEFDYSVRDIAGSIPDGLRGALYRIGPGRLDVGGHPVGHIFDGDGMVSRFAISDQGVHYRNRYVRTKSYLKSNRKQLPAKGFGTQRAGGMLGNALRFPANLANTNVLVHHDSLYALWEGGPPHALDLETLQTYGPERFGGALKRLGAFSAHPKVDPRTGDVYNFGLDFYPRPMIRCYRLGRSGAMRVVGTIPIPKLGFVHDFALTEQHLVFVLGPLVVTQPIPALLGLKPLGEALSYEPQLGTTVVLVPRDGGPQTRIEYDPLFHFHATNAYEDDGNTVIELVTHNPGTGWAQWNNYLCNYRGMSGPAFGGTLTRLTVARRRGVITREDLNDLGCEFPQLDQRRATTRHRFTYLAQASQSGGNPNSISMIDHDTGRHDTYVAAGENTICEPLFAADGSSGVEGQGWLLSVEHQPADQCSRLIILRADKPSDGPVASATLRHHTPMTFHGAYVPA